MAEVLEFEFRATGDAQLDARLRSMSLGLQQMSGRATQATAATDRLTQSQQRASTSTQRSEMQLQRFGSTVGIAAGAVGQFSQSSGRMVATVGQATGAVSAMGAAFGPWGMAIAGAVTALSLLAQAFRTAEREARRAQRAMADVDTSLATERFLAGPQQHIAARQSAAEERALRQRLGRGEGTEAEQQGALDRAREVRESSEARAQSLRARIAAAGSNTAEGRALAEELETARSAAASARTQEQRAQEAMARARETQGIVERERRLAEEHAFALQEAEAQLAARQMRRGGGGRARAPARALGPIVTGRLGTAAGFEGGGAQDRLDELMLAAGAGGELDLSALTAGGIGENALAGTNDMRDALAGVADEMERARDAGQEFGAVLGEAFTLALEGEETFGAAFARIASGRLKALGVEEIAKGTGHVLEGAAMTLLGSPTGPALAAVGGKEIALGAALAGGGAALGAAAAGGGGGGGRDGGRGRPERPGAGRGGRDGDGPAAINVIMQGAIVTATTEAELGRRIERMVRAGQRRHGAST